MTGTENFSGAKDPDMAILRILLRSGLCQTAAVLSLGIFASLPAVAAGLEAGWLDKKNVLQETIVGADIRTIEVIPNDGSRKVSIAIPKSAVDDRNDVNEVVITGQRDEPPGNAIRVRHEWAADYENDYYGLVIYLGKDTAIPIRLYLKGEVTDNSQRLP